MQKKEKTITQLCQFGISKKEAKIYLALLKLGPSTVQEVAKFTKTNRSTTHVLCESLKEKGFLGQTRNRGKRLLFAETKEKFRRIVEEEKANIFLKEMTLDGLLPALGMIEPGGKGVPKVRFYEGEQGFMDLCQRSLDEANGEILFISSMDAYYSVTTQEYSKTYYVPERIRRGIPIKVLAFDDEYTRAFKKTDKEKLRQTRTLPANFPFHTTMFIYNNDVSIISSRAPFLGVLIEDVEHADLMRQMFNMIWEFVAQK